MSGSPVFFETPAALRRWFRKNHRSADELIVGYFKKHAVDKGQRSITWPESVAEALCFGWIDGIRRTLDGDRYTVRFTPRRPRSRWSAVNIRLMAELEAAGKMTAAGRAVFEARPDPDSPGYTASIPKNVRLDAACERKFKRQRAAWKFYQAQPPGYRRRMEFWIMQAKRSETRDRRLQQLIDASANQKRLM